VDEE